MAIPKFAGMTESSKIAATRQEMQSLKEAIVGNPSVVAGGKLIDRGFEGDVGFTPSRLQDLVVKPDSIAIYDKLTRLGWNGPYIDNNSSAYLSDAWETNYVYEPSNRQIIAIGGNDSILTTF